MEPYGAYGSDSWTSKALAPVINTTILLSCVAWIVIFIFRKRQRSRHSRARIARSRANRILSVPLKATIIVTGLILTVLLVFSITAASTVRRTVFRGSRYNITSRGPSTSRLNRRNPHGSVAHPDEAGVHLLSKVSGNTLILSSVTLGLILLVWILQYMTLIMLNLYRNCMPLDDPHGM
ncbi:unnamed protein product [Echinostoma caproni]|uniref:G_PROTEIN_RECEP_F1_2 domain-containing protein n=1 Tax=Echinostoma caproni TaxID=27848 RepID=A0A183AH65_9TREM|nr:unnamed protein product [Echinostoma caproni]